MVGVPNHPNWITFSRNSSRVNDFPRVIIYINNRLSSFYCSLHKDIFSHRDISIVSFFNCGLIYFLINVYLDSSQSALKYLKDTEANINNVLIMTGYFNIRDSIWDPNFPYHSAHSDLLMDIADSMSLRSSNPTNCILTKYLDNNQDSNLVINLMFLRPESEEFDSHSIHLD